MKMHQIFGHFLHIFLLYNISRGVDAQIPNITVTSTSINTVKSAVIDEDYYYSITTLSNETLTLSCNFTISNQKVSKSTFSDIYWRRGNDISSPRIQPDVGISITTDTGDNLNQYITTLRLNTNLTVRPSWLDNINPANTSTAFYLANLAGIYECVFNTTALNVIRAVATITMAPMVQKMDTQEVTSGNDATLNCFVYGYPRPSRYQWFKKNNAYVIIDGANNSTFTIKSTSQDNRTNYKCLAVTNVDNANGTMYLRVKDRYAVLWPCIGIIVEVVILLVITIIAAYQEHVKLQQIDKSLTKDM